MLSLLDLHLGKNAALCLHHPEINWIFTFQWLLLGVLELSWYLQARTTEELGSLIIKFIPSYCKWRQTASSPKTCWYNLLCWPQVWDTDIKWNIGNSPSLPLIDNNHFFFTFVYSLCYLWCPLAKEDGNITQLAKAWMKSSKMIFGGNVKPYGIPIMA